jgi:hypothetical protein
VEELKGIYRKTTVIKTPSGVVAAVLAGRPGGEAWDDKMRRLDGELEGSAELMTFQQVDPKKPPRRGDHRAMHTGLSYGGGSKVREVILRAS